MAKRSGPDVGFFDLWSRFYDAPWVQRLTYRAEQDAVLHSLQRHGIDRVLDVGCGTGLLTSRIREGVGGGLAVGCDFSAGMLAQAARKAPALPWVRGNALRLPFADGSFGAVVSTESFHWFPDQSAALREFFRVLEPGGRLFVALVNPRTEWLSRLTRLGSRVVGEPLRWPTRTRLRAETEAAGFRVESQRTIFRLPGPILLPCVLTSAVRPAGWGAA